MRPKDLYKRNSIVLSDDSVVKTVRMPLAFLSNRCSHHEANALRKLENLGFPHAPKLLEHRDNVITMTRVTGSVLGPKQRGNKDTFLSILACVGKLHSCGFAHGNLTRANILVSDKGDVHLIDFETNCNKSNPLFPIMKVWDYVRLYKLSHRTFQLDSDDIQGAFPPYARTAIRLVQPFYMLGRLATTLKRRAQGIVRAQARHRDLIGLLAISAIRAMLDQPFELELVLV
jgi:hypothetical protein